MSKKVQLEPAAQKFADDNAKPPFLYDLGPEKGRETVNEVQSGPADKPAADAEDLTIPRRSRLFAVTATPAHDIQADPYVYPTPLRFPVDS